MVLHKNLKYHEDDIKKHKITNQELEFLKELQAELNTQDTICQANPRFWVIKGTERIYHVEDEYDGFEFYDEDECSVVADGLEEMVQYLKENDDSMTYSYNKSRYSGEQIVAEWIDEDSDDNCIIAESKYEIQELIDLAGVGGIKVISYVNKLKIYENTMFLTQKDAEDHLKANHYHYSDDAHTYAMTAWRSNRVEKLIDILQSVDFGKEICCEKKLE